MLRACDGDASHGFRDANELVAMMVVVMMKELSETMHCEMLMHRRWRRRSTSLQCDFDHSHASLIDDGFSPSSTADALCPVLMVDSRGNTT